jgi:pyruvate formate lyase activating enzyme
MSGANGTKGMILHLQRLSTEDGPGIRTTVFFKGCPLACAWCHNPESIAQHPQVHWLENRCIGCYSCLEACPESALLREETDLKINREKCTGCGECAAACPSTALEMLGQVVEVDGLVKELEKDRAYFEKSGGGVTFSGGEPTLQSAFALNMMQALKTVGIPVALDTCGLCSTRALTEMLAGVDIVLFDLKLWDETSHRHWTGQGNTLIHENLMRVADWMRQQPQTRQLWIRTPLIPGATDTLENITAIGHWLGGKLKDSVTRWELCAFNNLGRDKYRRLGLDWTFQDQPLMSRERLDVIHSWANTSGFDPERIFITGASRVETA